MGFLVRLRPRISQEPAVATMPVDALIDRRKPLSRITETSEEGSQHAFKASEPSVAADDMGKIKISFEDEAQDSPERVTSSPSATGRNHSASSRYNRGSTDTSPIWQYEDKQSTVRVVPNVIDFPAQYSSAEAHSSAHHVPQHTQFEPIVQPARWFTSDTDQKARQEVWETQRCHRASTSEQLLPSQVAPPPSKSRSNTFSSKIDSAAMTARGKFQSKFAGFRSPRSRSMRRPSDALISSTAPTSPTLCSPSISAQHSRNASHSGSRSPYQSPSPLSLQTSVSPLTGILQSPMPSTDPRGSDETSAPLRRTATEPAPSLRGSPQIIGKPFEAFQFSSRTEETYTLSIADLKQPLLARAHSQEQRMTEAQREAGMTSSTSINSHIDSPTEPVSQRKGKMGAEGLALTIDGAVADSAVALAPDLESQAPRPSRSRLVRQTLDYSVAGKFKSSQPPSNANGSTA